MLRLRSFFGPYKMSFLNHKVLSYVVDLNMYYMGHFFIRCVIDTDKPKHEMSMNFMPHLILTHHLVHSKYIRIVSP